MSSHSDWRRVSKSKPCPICGKPDWCSVSVDGSVAICMRITSDKPTQNGGWLHRLADDPRDYRRPVRTVRLTPKPTPRADLPQLANRYRAAVEPDDLQRLANKLWLSIDSLQRLGIGWSADHKASSFPMTETGGQVRGIRLRRSDGFKFAVRGGHDALFIPAGLDHADSPVLLCEGVTDAAALLDMGFANVIGRPSCTGGTRLIVGHVKRTKPAEVAIISDADTPGLRGANALASVLVAYVPEVRVIQPPDGINDARAWLRAGATRQDVMEAIEAADVRRLEIRTIGIRV
ncbi:MAG: toprim domain-containing protein [Planctomycetes bacterium]|nr:toprim domain-containing protein [Planctomycetota bacterium]